MKIMFFALLLFFIISTLTLVSFASTVKVASQNSQTKYGALTYLYFETISGPSSSSPSTNTAQTPSSSSGSYAVSRGSSAYLWSPKFASATTVSSGNWVLDLWAAGSSSGTMTVSIYVTNSAGTAQSTIISSASTTTIGTSKTQIVMKFAGSSVSIPAGGYIEAVC